MKMIRPNPFLPFPFSQGNSSEKGGERRKAAREFGIWLKKCIKLMERNEMLLKKSMQPPKSSFNIKMNPMKR